MVYFAFSAANLPARALVLYLHSSGFAPARAVAGHLACAQADFALPPLGHHRLRPRTTPKNKNQKTKDLISHFENENKPPAIGFVRIMRGWARAAISRSDVETLLLSKKTGQQPNNFAFLLHFMECTLPGLSKKRRLFYTGQTQYTYPFLQKNKIFRLFFA